MTSRKFADRLAKGQEIRYARHGLGHSADEARDVGRHEMLTSALGVLTQLLRDLGDGTHQGGRAFLDELERNSGCELAQHLGVEVVRDHIDDALAVVAGRMVEAVLLPGGAGPEQGLELGERVRLEHLLDAVTALAEKDESEKAGFRLWPTRRRSMPRDHRLALGVFLRSHRKRGQPTV